jgi:hypothetical protein
MEMAEKRPKEAGLPENPMIVVGNAISCAGGDNRPGRVIRHARAARIDEKAGTVGNG